MQPTKPNRRSATIYQQEGQGQISSFNMLRLFS